MEPHSPSPPETTEPPHRSHAPRVPEGVTLRIRRFEFSDLDAIPQYWMAGNALITHAENTFSLMIPPGERFFIQSVRRYARGVRDPELRELVRGFSGQEGVHMRAHEVFNDSFRRFGIDVDREVVHAERAIARLERYLPHKMQLGATVFLEHLTATGAHILFSEPVVAESMHPEALRFWRWHAVEELEHKAVAFDVFTSIGGGYLLRVLSAAAALALLAGPAFAMFRRMLRDDGVRVTAAMRREAQELNRKIAGPQLRLVAHYFKPGFHPWSIDDAAYIRRWYAQATPV